MIRIPNFSFTRIKMQSHLPLAQVGVSKVVGTDLHVGDEVDGKSQFEENTQFSAFFFLSKY